MSRTALSFLGLAFVASAVLAQGVITDGDVRFEYSSFGGEGGALGNLEVDAGTDHLFGQWWYYRIAGDGAESAFPPPDMDTYAGNVATLEWMNVDGRGFRAREVVTLLDAGSGAGLVRHDLTITNPDVAPDFITVFHYNDFDLDDTNGGDSAVAFPPTAIGVMDTSRALFRGLGGDDYEVAPFPLVRDALDDATVTDLANSGLPFGTGDWTGAIQWREIAINGGASITYSVVKSVNVRADPLELAARGSCPGTVSLRVHGVVPDGAIELWGAGALGSFTLPDGDCAGLDLGLGSASLLATVTANASGRRRLELELDAESCDLIVQAVDLTSCAATNVDSIP